MGSIDRSHNVLPSKEAKDSSSESDNSIEEGEIAAGDDDVVVVPRKQRNKRQSDDREGQIATGDDDVGQIAAEKNKRQRTESDDECKKIFVKMTKTIVCSVRNTDTINDIKMLVENMEGIASINQQLFFRWIRLKGSQTIGDYNIPANSCIEMYVKDVIRISIESNMNSLSLNVKISNTVSQVKALMRVEGGIPSDEDITLFFAYKMLHEDQTLGSCGVHHNAVLRMVTRRCRTLLVTVKLLNGSPIELEVQSWYSIAQLKNILGSPQLLLSYGDKLLEDKKSLHHYNINDHAVLKERLA